MNDLYRSKYILCPIVSPHCISSGTTSLEDHARENYAAGKYMIYLTNSITHIQSSAAWRCVRQF